MRTTIRRWGNSLALRVPREVAADAGMGEGTVVELIAEEGRIVAERVADG